MARFRDLLPLTRPESVFDSGEGGTRCLHAKELGRLIGLDALWLKVEADNPTRTVKDRQAPVALAALRECGVDEFVTASTGNAATSMARVLSRLPGMRAHIFIGDDFLDRVSRPEDPNITVYWTPHESFVGACEAAAWFARHAGLVRDDGFFFFGRREGLKTVYLEAGLQIPGDIEYYVQGVSSAIGVFAASRAARELRTLGHTRSIPRFICVQEAGCAPMARAFARGSAAIEAGDIVLRPTGVAHATHRGDPSRTYPLIRDLVAASGGTMVAVPEDAVVAARSQVFDTEGLDVCAASALTIAAAAHMARTGQIQRGAIVLLNLTGGDRPPSRCRPDFIVERQESGWSLTPNRH